MAKTSTELMPNLPAQDNPFSRRISTLVPVEEGAEVQDQPRDYANVATGLLKDEPEKIVEEPKAS